jgi:hypothetical protein
MLLKGVVLEEVMKSSTWKAAAYHPVLVGVQEMMQVFGSIVAPGKALQTAEHSFPMANLQRTVSWSASWTGILMVWAHPDWSLTMGVVVVTGEELILPLSDLRARLPFTLISHPHPPALKLIQQLPVKDISKFVTLVPIL